MNLPKIILPFFILLFVLFFTNEAAKAHGLWHRSHLKIISFAKIENKKPISLACGQMIHKYMWHDAIDSISAKPKNISPKISENKFAATNSILKNDSGKIAIEKKCNELQTATASNSAKTILKRKILFQKLKSNFLAKIDSLKTSEKNGVESLPANGKKEIEINGLLSFICFALFLATEIIFIPVAPVVFLILSFILGIISLHKHKKYKSKYGFNIFAILGVVLCSLVVLIAILAFAFVLFILATGGSI